MQTPHKLDWTPKQITGFWDYQSNRPSARENYFSATHGTQIAKYTRRWLRKSPSVRVLDMGCGTGAFLSALAQVSPGLLLAGTDFSADSVACANSACQSIRPSPDIRTISGYPTPWGDEFFDVIYVIEVIEHLSDEMLDAMMTESSRLLKPGGRLIVTTPNDEDLERQSTCCPNCGTTFHIWQHVRSWSVSSLSTYMRQRGFEPVRVKATLIEPFQIRAAAWLARLLRLSRKRPPHLVGVFKRCARTSAPNPAALPETTL
ncbi:class I SAM-dependent methyltransferase [Rhodanobacter ginsenosidimutans]|uniref:Class I SAM-dependent methyltransferase n=1 Tax=Rhodanobacter ginsenosidimutans TaxID=490571 RepID=A0ABW0JYJ0_9GAMM